jgi:hypothetical protein
MHKKTCSNCGELNAGEIQSPRSFFKVKKVLILPVPEPEGPFLVLPGRTQARSTWQRR